MTNLVNPYRLAASAGGGLPATAIATANFVDEFFYAGGAETLPEDMFDLYKAGRNVAGIGYLVDWNIDQDGLNAKGALLADIVAATTAGLTFVMVIEGPYAPMIEWIYFGDNTDMNDAAYYFLMGGGSNQIGVMWDSGPLNVSGPNGEIEGVGGGPGADPPVVNTGAFCAFRDGGGGVFSSMASINGNLGWGDPNHGKDGSTLTITHCKFGGAPEWYLALGPDDYIREITLYGPKTDGELRELTGGPVAPGVTITGDLAIVDAPDTAIILANDSLFSNVSFLSGFEGADASTSVTDEGPTGHTVTAENDAQIDTAQFKMGTSSLLLDGTGDVLTCANNAEFQFGSGEFTIECFVRFSGTGLGVLAALWDTNGQRSWQFRRNATNAFRLYVSTNGTTETQRINTSGTGNVPGVWYHLALDKDSSNKYRIYFNGVMSGSATVSETLHASTAKLSIGGILASGSPSGNYLAGWLDELRITKGVARYASDSGFTPPAQAYPRD